MHENVAEATRCIQMENPYPMEPALEAVSVVNLF